MYSSLRQAYRWVLHYREIQTSTLTNVSKSKFTFVFKNIKYSILIFLTSHFGHSLVLLSEWTVYSGFKNLIMKTSWFFGPEELSVHIQMLRCCYIPPLVCRLRQYLSLIGSNHSMAPLRVISVSLSEFEAEEHGSS